MTDYEEDQDDDTPTTRVAKVNPLTVEGALAKSNYELEAFTSIKETDDDRATTVSDLQILNNHLAVCNAILPGVMTIAGLCALSQVVCKLIETRRKVKKLSYGESAGSSKGKIFEVIE